MSVNEKVNNYRKLNISLTLRKPLNTDEFI